ncbi:MAG: NAD(+)/NADH kinase [Spirochaetaceae bacterium]|nr:NAD(+)/NADH kinase [Spirochaetaceae bacterium]
MNALVDPAAPVGVIANPAAATDIRRVVANATGMPIADRANTVLRVLAALGACGVPRVLMMPEKGGIGRNLTRSLRRERNLGRTGLPVLHFTATPVTGTVADTHAATRAMAAAGVQAIVVLGGDGTHRAVAGCCGEAFIAGISTGTNNAFPEHREPTITGLAVGLAVTGRVPAATALQPNKMLQVTISDGRGGRRSDVALVDVSVTTEPYVGARALWRSETLREIFVTFADPEAIGLSAVAGLLRPVGRREPHGLRVELQPPDEAATVLRAPIAPGLITPVGVRRYETLAAQETISLHHERGMISLDGERELHLRPGDRAELTLLPNAFRTLDVGAVMRYAAQHRLLTR